jgi:glycosyltransferase involved in cell wall biosynthesis
VESPNTARATLVVVPAWNEESSIELVVSELLEHGFDVVVVSDGSTDATVTKARKCGAHVIELPINLGVGGALRAGFRYATAKDYALIVQCDADGQHPAEEIRVLLDAQARTGAHLVIGSRFADGGTFETSRIRRLAMWLLAYLAGRITHVKLTDVSSGFRVFSRPLFQEFAREFPSAYLGDTFEAVISAGRANYRLQEVAVTMRQRMHGESTATTTSAVRFLVRVLLVVIFRIEFRIKPFDEKRE